MVGSPFCVAARLQAMRTPIILLAKRMHLKAHRRAFDVRDLFAREVATRHLMANVVDAGCGTGALTARLDLHMDTLSTVTGVDVCAKAIEKAERAHPHIGFIHKSINELANHRYHAATLCFVAHEQTSDELDKILHALTTITEDVYVLDINPEVVRDFEDFQIASCSPLISRFARDAEEVLAAFGASRVPIPGLPDSVCAWHIDSYKSETEAVALAGMEWNEEARGQVAF